MTLARFDLNLLTTLDAIDRTRSVQQAAAHLHVTPSAVSHALRRLRDVLGDPLFVRTGQTLVPTARCRSVLTRIRPFLAEVAAGLDAPAGSVADAYDPAAERRAVTVVMPGAVDVSLVPVLSAQLFQDAPGWTMAVRDFQRRGYEADLLSGDVDAVLSVGGHSVPDEGLVMSTLWVDELVALQGPAGPLPDEAAVTLDEVIAYPQIYPVPWPRTQSYLDIRLAREGRQRPIALSMPGYAALGETLARTSLVATLPDRTALALRHRHPDLRLVRIVPAIHTPLTLETSARFATSPAGRWFLHVLRKAAEALPTLVAPQPSPDPAGL